MSPPPADPVVDVLTRSRKGGVGYAEIASLLATLDAMHVLVSQADVRRVLDDWDEHAEEHGIGSVTSETTHGPRVLGTQTEDGRLVPRVFTSGELMHEYAVSTGTVDPSTSYLSQSRSWASGLYRFLAEGCGGIVLDDGTDHRVAFDRTGLMHLVSQITLAAFAAKERLFALAVGGRVYLEECDEAGGEKGSWAFVYDSEEAAQRGVAALRSKSPDFVTVPVAPAEHFRGLLGSRMTRLQVNPALADARAYGRQDVVRMVELAEERGAPAPDAETMASESAGPAAAVDPALDPDAAAGGAAPRPNDASTPNAPTPLWDRVRSAPPPAAIPRPGRDGDAARARLLEVKRMGDEGAPPWALSLALGFDLDVHASVFPQVIEGRRWPMLYQDQDRRTGREVKITHLYSTRERVEAELSRLPAEKRSHLALSCVEALRWAWACPEPIVDVFVDHPDPAGSISFPTHWALPMLFPSFLGVGDLDGVPAVPLGRLGQLPRIEGLDPRALRALVRGWQALLGPPSDPAVEYEPIAHAGGRYLPIYSEAEQFFSCSKASGNASTPEAAGDAPPFADWLARARACDGLVLDPGAVEPLTLDPADVFFLALWSKLGAQPEGWQVTAELCDLVRSGRIDSTLAGCIAADWPSYLAALTTLDGGQALVMVPGTDDLAVFTDYQRYHDFVWAYRTAGLLKEEAQERQIVSRWQANVFRAAHEMFSGLWIDPVPLSDDAGVRLDGAALDAALARLEQRLRPRVPGFEG